ncbi:MAG: organoarsenical effux MFS transporter ArsJ [Gammaproteobacteria bacterium]|nr:organoarsenical effux MFS transporter ArsJ [Gammaproteobacteria bacterium]
MNQGLRNYLIITGSYWAFTLTDGAIRMLVVLYFHLLGYSPIEVAMLFLFYEFFGIVTNLIGGWLASRIGLNLTMHIGMSLQIVALAMLAVPDQWLSIAYVMFAQALSGIAKDLNKMSAKASIKTLLPADQSSDSSLFKWVAILTGSKNALKGLGYFLGTLLLQLFEFRGALIFLVSGLAVVLIASAIFLPSGLGKSKSKTRFTQIFSKTPAINWLSAARFFLFASRDIWFVVALPVYLHRVFEWDYTEVGAFMAFWIIGYGIVQASAPRLLKQTHHGQGPDGSSARNWAFLLALLPVLIAIALNNTATQAVLIIGLIIFGIVFAINSAVHSYLIVAWSDHDKVAMNVGFYYMANAGGRLFGTVLSGFIYQTQGLTGCLYYSSLLVVFAALLSLKLQKKPS